ncbi:MAG: hypothetical protein IPI73_24675 [Betaproteobacteria bacterium]|nr:hypothetical protein [Betaproteobacteria bacterium]
MPVPQPNFSEAGATTYAAPVPAGTRRTYFETCNDFLDCPIFERASLLPGSCLQGPAIIEQMDATTVIPPDFEATTDDWGNLILRPIAKAPQHDLRKDGNHRQRT